VPEIGIGELVDMGILVGGNGVAVGSGVAEGGNVAVGIAVCVSATAVLTIAKAVSIASVGFVLEAGWKELQEVNIITASSIKIIPLLVIFIFPVLFYVLQGNAQRFALPALGRAAERRPTGKRLRRRKRLGIAPDSPASGARFVRQPARLPEQWLKNTPPLTRPTFTHNFDSGNTQKLTCQNDE
jgi:hypothetical protein